MCAFVAYNYCDMLYGIECKGNSAPAYVAFVYAIPFLVGILVSSLLVLLFRKKARNQSESMNDRVE
jgi:hypothetical protein